MKKLINKNIFTILFLVSIWSIGIYAVYYLLFDSFLFNPLWLFIPFCFVLFSAPFSFIEIIFKNG